MDVHDLAFAILNHAIQLTLLASLVWCVARLFAKNRPHLAHALWILVLIKCVVPPAWSSPTSLFNLSAFKFSNGPLDRSPIALLPIPKDEEVESELRPYSSDLQISVVVSDDNKLSSEPESTVSERLQSQPVASSWLPFIKIPKNAIVFGIGVLAVGFVVGLLLTCVRLMYFLKTAYSNGYYSDSEMDDYVRQLSKRMGVKRHVSVRMVRNPIGPVVLGLIRPKLLLPDLIVRGRKLAELEPLIAHELIHIRRGDLWWSMLQTVATSLWWFHPLVRFAGQMVSRETERSCDEETVASLGCSPAAYARSLLDVLERKHQLQIAPALPGVRPIEVTLDRMERIMKLGQGSHKRAPRWIWAAMFVGCAIALPSGSVGVAQDGKKLESTELAQAAGAVKKAVNDVASPWVSYREDIGDLIDALNEQGMSNEEAQRWIRSQLPSGTEEITLVENTRLKRGQLGGWGNSDLGISGQLTIADVPMLLWMQYNMQIMDRELKVFDSQEKIDEIKTKLQFLHKTCKKRVSCEVKTIQFKKDDFTEVSANWRSEGSLTRINPDSIGINVDSDALIRLVEIRRQKWSIKRRELEVQAAPHGKEAVQDAANSQLGLAFEFARPISYTLDEEQVDAILKRKGIRCVTAPRVTGRSGQTVTMSFGAVSKADEEQFLRSTSLELTPTLIEGDKISLRTMHVAPGTSNKHIDLGTSTKRPWNDTGGHGKRFLAAMRVQNPNGRITLNATGQLIHTLYEQGKVGEDAETYKELLDAYPDSELQFLTTEAQVGKTHVICIPTTVDGEERVLTVLVKCSVVDPPKAGTSATFDKASADMNGFVNVGGTVKRPDRYELDKPTNVTQAIAAAGGIQVPGSEPSSVIEVIILRQFNGAYILSKFTLDRSQLGTETTRADVLWLKKNDIVFVKPASSTITSAQARKLSRTIQVSIFEHVPVIGPATAGLVHEIPQLANHEVMHALNKQREANGKYVLDIEQYSRIEIEKLAESKDDERSIPLIGDAVLCHTFYQCTVYLKDTDEREVVFIDHNHFHKD